jgi:hypothetical protein
MDPETKLSTVTHKCFSLWLHDLARFAAGEICELCD